jgi:membrane protein required for colicin V production
MSIFDISLLIILGGFVLNGLFKGIIRMIGQIVGLIVGAYVAANYYLALYAWGQAWAAGHENIGKILAFIILFILVARLTDLAFVLAEKAFKIIAIIPGSKYINNLLGAVLGFLEGALALGLILYVISRYTLIGNFFGDQLSDSLIAPILLDIVGLIMPFLPEALKALRSII